MALRKQEILPKGVHTAVYQVQMAPAQRVQSQTSHYHYHALGHCTLEPRKLLEDVLQQNNGANQNEEDTRP